MQKKSHNISCGITRRATYFSKMLYNVSEHDWYFYVRDYYSLLIFKRVRYTLVFS